MFDISELIESARVTVDALLQQSMTREGIQWQKVATPIDSMHSIYKMNWIGGSPILKEFKGEVEVAPVYPHDYTIEIEEYAIAVAVKLRTLRTQGLVDFSLVVRNMTDAVAGFYEKLVMETLSDGFTEVCFDGNAFYSAAHSWGKSGTHNNVATGVLNETNFITARKTIQTAKDDQGEPMGKIVTALVFGPDNWATAKKLFSVQILPGGGDNILYNAVELVESSRLKTDPEWHVLATGGATKPVVLAEQLAAMTSDDIGGQSDFWNHAVHFQVQAEVSPGYGMFPDAYGSTGAGP